MSLDEYDSYYTPDPVADRLMALVEASRVERCFDSNCGDGKLLRAAIRQFGNVKCVGLDKDKRAIAALRRDQPRWSLWLGDNLRPQTWGRMRFAEAVRDVDLVLMNPPFSMQAQKGVAGPVECVPRCSVAMAHVVATLSNTTPLLCAAIVPESFYYSDIDAVARDWIDRNYAMKVHTELQNTTFRGTRANALLITLRRRGAQNRRELNEGIASDRVTRGGLPLHEAKRSRKGIPLVHSTCIGPLVRGHETRLPLVRPIARGVVSGHLILVPRVGNVVRETVFPVFIPSSVQLSDCVLALHFRSRAEAVHASRKIHKDWDGFSSLWRGTGARYVTVSRFTQWIAKNID